MSQGAWVISILLGIIAVLFSVAVKLVLSKMTDLHAEAMNHLTTLTTSVREVSQKIDQHLRDHATGEFKA